MWRISRLANWVARIDGSRRKEKHVPSVLNSSRNLPGMVGETRKRKQHDKFPLRTEFFYQAKILFS